VIVSAFYLTSAKFSIAHLQIIIDCILGSVNTPAKESTNEIKSFCGGPIGSLFIPLKE
jgi:hypothetical protein